MKVTSGERPKEIRDANAKTTGKNVYCDLRYWMNKAQELAWLEHWSAMLAVQVIPLSWG